MSTPWDFEGYWNAVMGASRTPADVVREFELDATDRAGLDEWIGTAEVAAWQAGWGEYVDMPPEWSDLHGKALDALAAPDYCVQNNGDCSTCSLVNYGRDCTNQPV